MKFFVVIAMLVIGVCSVFAAPLKDLTNDTGSSMSKASTGPGV